MPNNTAFSGNNKRGVRARWAACALTLLVFHGGFCATSGVTQEKRPASFRVEVYGHGRPMVLIPGYSSSGDTWKSAVDHFRDQYTCYVLTLAGFAGVPPIAAPLLATVRVDLEIYIRQKNLDKPVIVGHSLGGTLALELAAQAPDLVGALVIVDALPFMAGPTFRVKNTDEAKPGIAAMRAYMLALTPEQRAEFVRSAVGFRHMVTSLADLELLKKWELASDPKAATEAMSELYGTDLRPELSRISAPTLVLGTWIGLQEQIKQYSPDVRRDDFVDTFRQQYATLPHLHFAMSDKARHFIMFDDPPWFFHQVDVFLSNPLAATKDRGFSGK